MKGRYFEALINQRTGEETRSAFLAIDMAQAKADQIEFKGRTFRSLNRKGEPYLSRDGKVRLYFETTSGVEVELDES